MKKYEEDIETLIASELRQYAVSGEFSTRRIIEELQEYKVYREAMEEFIEGERGKENAEYREAEAKASSLPKDKQDSFWDWYNDSAYLWADSFGSHLRASFITGLVTLVERFLKDLSSDLRRIHPSSFPIRESELAGKFHERIRKYLVTFGKFNVLDEQWKKLANIYFIRNAIVHDGGNLAAKAETVARHQEKGTIFEYWKQKEREFGINYPDLKLRNLEIILSREYCTRAESDIEMFFEVLEQEKNKFVGACAPRSVEFGKD